jgi:hypothetical protein
MKTEIEKLGYTKPMDWYITSDCGIHLGPEHCSLALALKKII